MRISIKFLESVLLGLIASVGYGQQVIDNVGIGLNGPHYGVRQNISSFTGWNGGWARGFHIGEDSDPNNPILMSFGAYGDVRATGAPTLIYGYIGKDWTKTFMTFSPNGNVGVGTNGPNERLHLGKGNFRMDDGDMHVFNYSNRMVGYNDRKNYYIGAYPVTGSSGLDLHWYGGIKFGTRVGDVMQIADNGNVGVGTDNPAEKMEVKGGYLRITNSGQEGPALSLYNPDKTEAGAVWRIYNMTGLYSNSLQFWNYPSNFSHGYQRLILHDNGDMNVNGNITLSKNLYASDIVSGGSNSWIFHTPDDGRNTLHIAPRVNNNWEWGKALIVKADGNTAVQGKLEAKEIKVTTTPTADFVFAEDYKLPKLSEVEKHLKEKRHLPEIASAKVMEQEGVNVGEFQIKLLQKIEELTLYVIEQQKQLEIQNKRIQELEKKNRSNKFF